MPMCNKPESSWQNNSLETTDQPIEQIREATGYLDPAAFRRAFRRAAGISPRQYRTTYTTRG
jgi:transcriptional regulator GlxA family with amidase domain